MMFFADIVSVFDPSSYLEGAKNVLVGLVDSICLLLVAFASIYVTMLAWDYYKECILGVTSDASDDSGFAGDDSEFLDEDGFYKDGYIEEDGTEYDRYGNPV